MKHLYQDFSKEALKKIFYNTVTILLLSIIEYFGLRFLNATTSLSMFLSIGCFLMMMYMYLKYLIAKLYDQGPHKIFIKPGDKIEEKNVGHSWSVQSVEEKEIVIISPFNEKKRIHWKELDKYNLKF